MRLETAKKLSGWINKQNDKDIQLYVEERVSLLHKQLELAENFEAVLKIQGQIKEVKRLLTLKNEIERMKLSNEGK